MASVADDKRSHFQSVLDAKRGVPSHRGRPRLEALTTLRFFAALDVILFHLKVEGILTGGPWWYQNFAGIGYIGVNFFFVLSGFILVYTYGANDLEPHRFWQARFARIYPAYVFSLAVTAPFFFFAVRHLDLPFFAWSGRHFAWALVLTLALLQAWIPQGALSWNPVGWSLSVEAFFYAVFPFLLRWVKARSRRKLLFWIGGFSLISLSFSVAYIVAHPDGAAKVNSREITLFWKNLLSFSPLVRLPEFVVGMLTGRLFLTRRVDRKLGSICALGGAGGILLITILAARIPNPLISAGFLSPAFAAIIFGVAQQPRWTRLLALPLLTLLGEASYSLYLLHSFVMTSVYDDTAYLSHGVRVAVCVAAAIAASLVSYKLIEEPARRFLRPRKAD
jgi:peptidoglycan/LPS O-acetylase OafA/YrhL